SDDGPGGAQLAQVRTRLTLPYLDDTTVDSVNGGTFGGRGNVAHELLAAVASWKPNALNLPRLVIPLAVGWDGGVGAANESSSQAVHDALLHAACYGAFVAAAAGNDTGGPNPATGPLYPAAWESENAPGLNDCASLCDLPAIPGYM